MSGSSGGRADTFIFGQFISIAPSVYQLNYTTPDGMFTASGDLFRMGHAQ
jgi:hypothetical protein